MNRKSSLLLEFLALFFALPSLMAIGVLPRNPIPYLILLGLIIAWFYREEIDYRPRWQEVRRPLGFFLLGAPPMVLLSYFLLPERFLILPIEKTKLWIMISILYPLLSVSAQELIFRFWFWKRYLPLFREESYLILASTLAFGYGHVVLRNLVACALCLIGGALFSITYSRTKTFFPVWLEHSLWGVLLFTLGFGKYLYHGSQP